MARLAIFIDGGYINALSQYEFGHVNMDMQKLAEEVRNAVAACTSEPVDLLRTLYYTCPPYQSNPPTQDESDRYAAFRRFADALSYLPRFEVRLGRLQFQGVAEDGRKFFQQKRVDLLLGLDIALLSGKHQISHAAIVAGDGDFVPAVQTVKQEGVAIWLFHGPRSGRDGNSTYSQDLWREADERVEIEVSFMQRITKF